jgi:hypothetical protein
MRRSLIEWKGVSLEGTRIGKKFFLLQLLGRVVVSAGY